MPGGELMDAETKQVVIRKTWCHGQAVAPVYGILCLWWYVSNGFQPQVLLLPAFILPYWSYWSYKCVFADFHYSTLWMGGLVAEVCHIIVFFVAKEDLSQTWNLLWFVAAILFFIETAAFLGVVAALRPKENGNSSTGTTMGTPFRDQDGALRPLA